MTMSLSVARPIVTEPAGFGSAPDRDGNSAWNIFVARLPTSGGLAALGDIWVCGVACAAASAGGAGNWVAVAARWSDTRVAARRRLVGYTGCPAARPGDGRMRSRIAGAAQFGGRPGPAEAGRSGDGWTGLTRRLRGRPCRSRGVCRHGDAHRLGLGRAPGHPLVAPDLEGQQWPVGISDVDALAVVDVDHRHPAAVDESPVERTVVDRQPPALVEAQQQMGARNQRVRDAHVGAEIAADHHVVTRCEGAFRPVMPNGQRWRGWCTHCHNSSL